VLLISGGSWDDRARRALTVMSYRGRAVTHSWPGNQQVAVGVMVHLPSATHRISNQPACAFAESRRCVFFSGRWMLQWLFCRCLRVVLPPAFCWSALCNRTSIDTHRHFDHVLIDLPMGWYVNNGTARKTERAPPLGVRGLQAAVVYCKAELYTVLCRLAGALLECVYKLREKKDIFWNDTMLNFT